MASAASITCLCASAAQVIGGAALMLGATRDDITDSSQGHAPVAHLFHLFKVVEWAAKKLTTTGFGPVCPVMLESGPLSSPSDAGASTLAESPSTASESRLTRSSSSLEPMSVVGCSLPHPPFPRLLSLPLLVARAAPHHDATLPDTGTPDPQLHPSSSPSAVCPPKPDPVAI